MLNNYLELLKNLVNIMSQLGNTDATLTDYFCTVGYELLVLGIGLLYLLAIAFIMCVPKIIIKYIWKDGTLNKGWMQHIHDIEIYNKFRREYDDLIDELRNGIKNKKSESELQSIAESILHKLDTRSIPHKAIDLDNQNLNTIITLLPSLVYGNDSCRETYEPVYPGDFEPYSYPKTYGFGFCKSFYSMYNLIEILRLLATILFVVLYVIIILPLILCLL